MKQYLSFFRMRLVAGLQYRAAALAVIAYVPGLSGQGDAPLTESQAAGWEMFDAGIAAQTFCLAARDLGIGTCILGIFDADAAGRLLLSLIHI